MIYLKLNKNKTLSYNQIDDLQEEENLSNKLSFYLPDEINGYNINSYKILVYLKKSDETGDVIEITQDNNVINLEKKHLYGSKYLKIWLVAGLTATKENFITNILTFDIIPSNNINEPPSNPQITYFEKIREEFKNKEIPNKISDLYNDLNYVIKKDVIDIIKTLAYYDPNIEGDEI